METEASDDVCEVESAEDDCDVGAADVDSELTAVEDSREAGAVSDGVDFTSAMADGRLWKVSRRKWQLMLCGGLCMMEVQ